MTAALEDPVAPGWGMAHVGPRTPRWLRVLVVLALAGVLAAAVGASFVLGPTTSFSRQVRLGAWERPVPERVGQYRVLLVAERSWLHQSLTQWGLVPIEFGFGWRDAVCDPRQSALDTAWGGEDAWVASQRLLGHRMGVTPYVEVMGLAPHSALRRAGLEVGDLIRAVDGVPRDARRTGELLTDGRRELTLTVERAGVRRHVTLEPLASLRAEGTETYSLRGGWVLADHAVADGPKLTARVPRHERGPSSGLAHALAMVDADSPGRLDGGMVVAATGVVTPEGRVLPIGKVGVKVRAALSGGADVMLVPGANLAEARRAAAGRIPVIGVGYLDQAVTALCARGGRGAACTAARHRHWDRLAGQRALEQALATAASAQLAGGLEEVTGLAGSEGAWGLAGLTAALEARRQGGASATTDPPGRTSTNVSQELEGRSWTSGL